MRLSEGLINSGMEVDQQEQLIEEEYQDDLLMIGGIGIFLPFSQEEAKIGVVDATMTEEQSAKIVQEELEKTLEASQTGEENERSK
jgi:hypothetical protein